MASSRIERRIFFNKHKPIDAAKQRCKNRMMDKMDGIETTTSAAAARERWRPLLIVLLACSASAALYLFRGEPPQQAVAAPRLSVDAIEVTAETLTLEVISQGSVTPSLETQLVAEVQGRITHMAENFVAGGFFRRGELMLRIDNSHYRAALKRAEATLASARARLAEERGRADVAYRDWQRHNPGNRAAEAKSLALREPQIAEAKANLTAANAELEKAKQDLARTAITAPYDGLLQTRQVGLGQHLGIGSTLGRYFSTARVEVRLPVAEHQLPLLDLPAVGQSDHAIAIAIESDINGQTSHWPASLSRVEAALDTRSRALYVVATVEDPYQIALPQNEATPPLRVGSFVRAAISGKTLNGVFRLPQEVLQSNNHVWLIDGDGQLQQQKVKRIGGDRHYAYITEGLHSGDRVAMGYIDDSVPGSQIHIAELITLPPVATTTALTTARTDAERNTMAAQTRRDNAVKNSAENTADEGS